MLQKMAKKEKSVEIFSRLVVGAEAKRVSWCVFENRANSKRENTNRYATTIAADIILDYACVSLWAQTKAQRVCVCVRVKAWNVKAECIEEKIAKQQQQ